LIGVFLIVMVVGLVGLGVMAVPALGHRGGIARGVHKVAVGRGAHTGYLPSPRLVFSMLALYGAFGNALVAANLPVVVAALLAIVPAGLVERFAVTPLWRTLFAFERQASRPLEELVMSEATAVTAFRGGRGVVSIVRERRLVQFSARLIDAQAALPVRVGDRLRVEDIDPTRERVTVSVLEASA
jgi:hypothetical protein